MPLPMHRPLPVLKAEDIAADAPKVAAFLRALEAGAPGRVPEELLADIESLSRPGLALDLFMERVNGSR